MVPWRGIFVVDLMRWVMDWDGGRRVKDHSPLSGSSSLADGDAMCEGREPGGGTDGGGSVCVLGGSGAAQT